MGILWSLGVRSFDCCWTRTDRFEAFNGENFADVRLQWEQIAERLLLSKYICTELFTSGGSRGTDFRLHYAFPRLLVLQMDSIGSYHMP